LVAIIPKWEGTNPIGKDHIGKEDQWGTSKQGVQEDLRFLIIVNFITAIFLTHQELNPIIDVVNLEYMVYKYGIIYR
jgi:hypothetical protein